jgi:hypothetical protein
MSDPLAFDPLPTYAAAQKAAREFAKDPVAIGLAGHRGTEQWSWQWTLLGEGSVAVEVISGPAGTSVRAHETRNYFRAPVPLDPATVRLNPAGVAAALAKAGRRGRIDALSLSAGAKGRVSWTASLESGETVSIDAAVGTIN